MKPFLVVTGKAAPMMAANIDTDVIMPKQFLKGIDRQGLDRGAFFDQRFLPDGHLNPEFILNRQAWQGSSFLVVGPNFGCGSSREHAVWGLNQLGIRALIGTSFAGIFNDNCQRNGLLTLTLEKSTHAWLMAAASDPDTNLFTIDLASQCICVGSRTMAFEIDHLKKQMILEGYDAIGYTLRYQDDIRAFEQKHVHMNPWFRS
jgi:3-isopropylmalate/(R)-2-methylmalate dehydratase small subunit